MIPIWNKDGEANEDILEEYYHLETDFKLHQGG